MRDEYIPIIFSFSRNDRREKSIQKSTCGLAAGEGSVHIDTVEYKDVKTRECNDEIFGDIYNTGTGSQSSAVETDTQYLVCSCGLVRPPI